VVGPSGWEEGRCRRAGSNRWKAVKQRRAFGVVVSTSDWRPTRVEKTFRTASSQARRESALPTVRRRDGGHAQSAAAQQQTRCPNVISTSRTLLSSPSFRHCQTLVVFRTQDLKMIGALSNFRKADRGPRGDLVRRLLNSPDLATINCPGAALPLRQVPRGQQTQTFGYGVYVPGDSTECCTRNGFEEVCAGRSAEHYYI
jgi:hypothetical protein